MLPEHLISFRQDCPKTSLLKHSTVKICTLKVSFLGLTLQVSMDLCYYVFYFLVSEVQTRPTEKDLPCICESQPVMCTFCFASTCIISVPSLFCHSSATIHLRLMVSISIFKIVWMSLNILS